MNYGEMMFTGSEQGPVAGFCVNDDETSGSLKWAYLLTR